MLITSVSGGLGSAVAAASARDGAETVLVARDREALGATQTVGVVDPGVVATDLTGGAGRDPRDVADVFVWAARDCPADDLDGSVVGLREWKRATR